MVLEIEGESTWEVDRGRASGTEGGDGILVLSIGGRVGEERSEEGVEGRGSENAFGVGERGVESEKERREKVEQRETEKLWLEQERWCRRYFPHKHTQKRTMRFLAHFVLFLN